MRPQAAIGTGIAPPNPIGPYERGLNHSSPLATGPAGSLFRADNSSATRDHLRTEHRNRRPEAVRIPSEPAQNSRSWDLRHRARGSLRPERGSQSYQILEIQVAAAFFL